MSSRSSLLLLLTLCLVGAGCVSKPVQSPQEHLQADAPDRDCENASGADPQIESVLTQQTADPRLTQINRRMYESLHSLDVELRREQRLAACPQPLSAQPTMEAKSSDPSRSGMGDSSLTGTGLLTALNAGVQTQASLNAAAPAGANFSRSGSLHKGAASAIDGGGNGATAPKTRAGSDNDIVARRLRKAAEQETDPVLRAKLWKEYTSYMQGTSAR